MTALSGNVYLFIKALHIIAVIAWMAGLLYLPRLFVYHAEAAPGSAASETFKVMERRLMRVIMNPAMLLVLVFGILMLHDMGWARIAEPWLAAKLVCGGGLLAVHMAMGSWRRAFAEDRNRHGARFFRMMNEVPTVLMIVIVLLAVMKPGA
ncbi:MAG: protoporphyrinogen oxidase HemJ [Rhodospirillales bacterium]